jgi:cephalosporin hydroxylase
MTADDVVRLSAWIFFVDHGENVAVHHTVSGNEWMADQATARCLERYAGFRLLVPDMVMWVDRGVLVRPFTDPLVAPPDSAEEGRLGAAWNDWYWKREVEAERDYRWQGEVVLKMPDDLFMYQELIFDLGVRRVLEIGYGRGGGLWFFASVLTLGGCGHVVGVEREPPERVPDFQRYSAVRVDRVHGDAHLPATTTAVMDLSSEFDLIVIDADPTPHGKLALLDRWAPFVSGDGVIVVEDFGSPGCVAQGEEVSRGLDRFLLTHPQFGIQTKSRRFATSKVSRAVLQLVGTEGSIREDAKVVASRKAVPYFARKSTTALVPQSTLTDLTDIVCDVRRALDEHGFYYCSTFSTDPTGGLLLALARALGSVYVPADVDPAQPLLKTQPSVDALYFAPFDRAEGIGWHNDFSTHPDRPTVSLANLVCADPDGPHRGAWRVASCHRVFEYLRTTIEGREVLRLLTAQDLPYSFAGEDPPMFFCAVEAHGSGGQRMGLRFYGRALRDGARLAYGRVPDNIEHLITVVETAADRVGHILAAPAGALLVTDNWHALHDRLPQSVDPQRSLRQSLLCFIDNLYHPIAASARGGSH